MRSFIRQKSIHCGEKYLEIDIFPCTTIQEDYRKNGKRSKRENVLDPKQKDLNDKNARRYFVQLGNTNFSEKDLHVTATYKDEFLPATIEAAEREVGNYLRRIDYRRKKEGLDPLKYILVTEYNTEENGEKPIRIHHHIFMNGGIDRDTVENIWCKRKRKGEKNGERIGWINADRLQPNENGITALSTYLIKRPRGKKRWSCSQNLKKPWSRNNDNRYSRREVERLAKNPPDISYWEKKYPGWTLQKNDYALKAEYNDNTGWSIYIKMRRLDYDEVPKNYKKAKGKRE